MDAVIFQWIDHLTHRVVVGLGRSQSKSHLQHVGTLVWADGGRVSTTVNILEAINLKRNSHRIDLTKHDSDWMDRKHLTVELMKREIENAEQRMLFRVGIMSIYAKRVFLPSILDVSSVFSSGSRSAFECFRMFLTSINISSCVKTFPCLSSASSFHP